MRFVGGLASLAWLAGCLASAQTVEVRITPDAYLVNSVTLALATPAVDEVVRIKPKSVFLLMCRGTPHAKIMQFEVELRSRHKSELREIVTEEGCAA